MQQKKYVNVLLRVGVAFAFLYPPIAAFFNPFAWIGFFPPFILDTLPHELLLHGFGVIEIIIGLWILSGKKIFFPSLVATVMLLAIVGFNVPQMDIVFRDLPIALMSLALVLIHWPKRRRM